MLFCVIGEAGGWSQQYICPINRSIMLLTVKSPLLHKFLNTGTIVYWSSQVRTWNS